MSARAWEGQRWIPGDDGSKPVLADAWVTAGTRCAPPLEGAAIPAAATRWSSELRPHANHHRAVALQLRKARAFEGRAIRKLRRQNAEAPWVTALPT